MAIEEHVSYAYIGKFKFHFLLRKQIWHPELLRICTDITRLCTSFQLKKVSNFFPLLSQFTIQISFWTDYGWLGELSSYVYWVCSIISANWLFCRVTVVVITVPLRNKTAQATAVVLKYPVLPFLWGVPPWLFTEISPKFWSEWFYQSLQLFEIAPSAHVRASYHTPPSKHVV